MRKGTMVKYPDGVGLVIENRGGFCELFSEDGTGIFRSDQLEKLELSPTMKRLAKRLVGQIMETSDDFRMRCEFAKLEHHDGEATLTRWADISMYSRSKCDANIVTWRNRLYSRKEVEVQVINFLFRCEAVG